MVIFPVTVITCPKRECGSENITWRQAGDALYCRCLQCEHRWTRAAS